jgi:hypothetical protein
MLGTRTPFMRMAAAPVKSQSGLDPRSVRGAGVNEQASLPAPVIAWLLLRHGVFDSWARYGLARPCVPNGSAARGARLARVMRAAIARRVGVAAQSSGAVLRNTARPSRERHHPAKTHKHTLRPGLRAVPLTERRRQGKAVCEEPKGT